MSIHRCEVKLPVHVKEGALVRCICGREFCVESVTHGTGKYPTERIRVRAVTK
jgi:hypothetical protein